jgi:hypothetical protein
MIPRPRSFTGRWSFPRLVSLISLISVIGRWSHALAAEGDAHGQPAAPAAATAPTGQRADEDHRAEDLRALADEDGGPRSRANVAAWVTTGISAALLGVAAFYGASASEKSGDANRLSTYRDPGSGVPLEYASVASAYEEDLRVSRRDDSIAKGFLISAAVTVAATVGLFIIDAVVTRAHGRSSE